MIQYNNFLIKREQSQARLSFAKREKSRLLAKTILTLALLLTAATGAWAQEQWDVVWDFTAWSTETVTALKADAAASKTEGWSDVEKKADAEAGAEPTEAAKDNCFWFAGTVNEDGSLSANGAVIKELKGLKFDSDYAAKRSLAIAVNYPSTNLGDYAGGAYLWLGGGGSKQTCPCFTIPGVKAGSKITIEVESNKPSDGRGIGLYKNSYAAENLIGEQFKPTAKEAKTWEIAEDCNVVVYNTNSCHIYTIKVKAPAAAGPKVAWDAATKTGTFTMPGGNVTLEPEYYPQAALTAAPTAINDVPATTDGAIVKPGTVANIGETTTAQGTVMYYVSTTALDDDALQALAADKWTADVPTAESLAQGQAYVYYYVRGNDSDTDEENFSDGDILAANALTVTIAAEPTYAVTFKAANANTIEAGKATVTVGGTAATVTDGKLEGVKMGSEVKVKAKEGYKFRKVKVKKTSTPN